MFTCRALKTEPRLGQQLWHVAAVIGLATKYQVGWVLPSWSSSSCFEHLAPQTALPLHVDAVLTPENLERPDPRWLDDFHVVDLRGCFESDRFFRHCDSIVRRQFEPRRSLIHDVSQRYAGLLARGRLCVVVAPFRVADGDNHVQRRQAFSAEVIAEVRDDAAFVIMSDDPAWWDAQLSGAHVIHLPRNNVATNFILGLLCNDTVVVDSAFGWWLAFLNQGEGRRVFMFESRPSAVSEAYAGGAVVPSSVLSGTARTA
jgi:hypothetical protein